MSEESVASIESDYSVEELEESLDAYPSDFEDSQSQSAGYGQPDAARGAAARRDPAGGRGVPSGAPPGRRVVASLQRTQVKERDDALQASGTSGTSGAYSSDDFDISTSAASFARDASGRAGSSSLNLSSKSVSFADAPVLLSTGPPAAGAAAPQLGRGSPTGDRLRASSREGAALRHRASGPTLADVSVGSAQSAYSLDFEDESASDARAPVGPAALPAELSLPLEGTLPEQFLALRGELDGVLERLSSPSTDRREAEKLRRSLEQKLGAVELGLLRARHAARRRALLEGRSLLEKRERAEKRRARHIAALKAAESKASSLRSQLSDLRAALRDAEASLRRGERERERLESSGARLSEERALAEEECRGLRVEAAAHLEALRGAKEALRAAEDLRRSAEAERDAKALALSALEAQWRAERERLPEEQARLLEERKESLRMAEQSVALREKALAAAEARGLEAHASRVREAREAFDRDVKRILDAAARERQGVDAARRSMAEEGAAQRKALAGATAESAAERLRLAAEAQRLAGLSEELARERALFEMEKALVEPRLLEAAERLRRAKEEEERAKAAADEGGRAVAEGRSLAEAAAAKERRAEALEQRAARLEASAIADFEACRAERAGVEAAAAELRRGGWALHDAQLEIARQSAEVQAAAQLLRRHRAAWDLARSAGAAAAAPPPPPMAMAFAADGGAEGAAAAKVAKMIRKAGGHADRAREELGGVGADAARGGGGPGGAARQKLEGTRAADPEVVRIAAERHDRREALKKEAAGGRPSGHALFQDPALRQVLGIV